METDKESLQHKYGELGGELAEVTLSWHQHQPRLGISLVGHRNMNTMSIFVCHVAVQGAAWESGGLHVGDQILEINGQSVYGRSHLNVSAQLLKSRGSVLKLVVRRSSENISCMACAYPQYPVTLSPSPGLPRQTLNCSQLPAHKMDTVSCIITKTKGEFGFAIMENGFHDEPGIFVKAICAESPAALEGTLQVGDRLMTVANHDISSSRYEEVLKLLQSCTGATRFSVQRPANPSASLLTPELPYTSLPKIHRISDHMSPSISTSQSTEGFPHPGSLSISPSRPLTTSQPAMNGAIPSSRQRKTAAWCMTSPTTTIPKVNPATCPILADGRDTRIEIHKANEPLGVGLVGGVGTTLGSIIISEVYEKGMALADGRLRPGDILLEINHTDVTRASVSEAHYLLCMSTGRVNLLVRRLPAITVDDYSAPAAETSPGDMTKEHCEALTGKKLSSEGNEESWWSHWREEDWLHLFLVEIVRKPGKGLGISIIGRQYGSNLISSANVPPGLQAVFVKEMIRGGLADQDGRIRPGDVILEINNHDVRHMSQVQVGALLKSCQGKIQLLLGRLILASRENEPKYGISPKLSHQQQVHECGKKDTRSVSVTRHPSSMV